MKKPPITRENFRVVGWTLFGVACALFVAYFVCAGVAEKADYAASPAAYEWDWD